MLTTILVDLQTSVLEGENVNEENVEEQLAFDANEPRFECLTDIVILNKAIGVNEEGRGKNESKKDKEVSMFIIHQIVPQHKEGLCPYFKE